MLSGKLGAFFISRKKLIMKKIKYQAHCKDLGWLDPVENGEIAGTVGEGRQMEAVRVIEVEPEGTNLDLYASVCELGQSGKRDENGTVIEGNHLGEDVGSTGLGLALEAFRGGLIGDAHNNYDLYYRLHCADIGWMNWAKNGEWSGTIGGERQAEAIQFMVVEKDKPFTLELNCVDKFIDLTPPPVVAPTETPESKRARVVAEAQQHIGYAERGGYSKFGDRFGDPYGAWCAYFDLSVFTDCGLKELCPPTGYCPTAVEWFLKHETAYFYRRGQYIPKNGDIIYFDYNQNGVPDHTGIVEGCSNGTVCTIEGNKGDMVKRQYYNINDKGIYGYGVPAY